ncbi:hypothetical protein NJL88_29415 [Streptomyces sp. DK15]|uniref:hypothetical protein n=1 Tax=Streptomyces sp. DK15 TaxID=2957499 RepID=UPI0029A71394|nr:hypothetical protein [Streptomyces sp. DK15]MDX2394107.1 hypothetical protein [Streptomyces sp. DK15]
MSRLSPPGSAFLPEIRVDTDALSSGHSLVTLSHPHAHLRNSEAEHAMLAIASRLGLRHGTDFPRTGQYIYNIGEFWALDYGHPRDCLSFSPTNFLWPFIARERGGTFVAVSLGPIDKPEAAQRILTGRLALRERAPREWR